jgi:hypothetical protein
MIIDKEKIKNDILSKNPEEFLKLYYIKEEEGNNVAKELVKIKYGISEDNIKAIEFCFWFCYHAEMLTQKIITGIEIKSGARKESIEKIINKLHFGDKISLMSELYSKSPKIKNTVKVLWKINDLRNSIAHGRFNELKYGNYHLSKLTGQIKIMTDYLKALKGI